MIIDVHGHVSPPPQLGGYQAGLIAARGAHGRGGVRVSDDQIRASHETAGGFGISHIQHIDEAHIDAQLLSPRPFTLMHSESPAIIVQWFAEETNNIIKQTCDVYPDRFRGICALPQAIGTAATDWIPELRRCIDELGFVGAMLNSDPHEGAFPPPPGLGDRFWYPLYEALCELDVPALVHPASCRPPSRETYSVHFLVEETIGIADLLNSTVYEDFPDLKLIFSHGGGAIPYQMGRFLAGAARGGAVQGGNDTFHRRFSKLYFDTCLYTRDSIELLIKTVGIEHCLFGSEKPGTGSAQDPATGRWYDDIKLMIDEIDWLTEDDRQAVYQNNAASIFNIADLLKS